MPGISFCAGIHIIIPIIIYELTFGIPNIYLISIQTWSLITPGMRERELNTEFSMVVNDDIYWLRKVNCMHASYVIQQNILFVMHAQSWFMYDFQVKIFVSVCFASSFYERITTYKLLYAGHGKSIPGNPFSRSILYSLRLV